MYEILQILSITVLHKTPVVQVFDDLKTTQKESDHCNQLALFDF